MRTKRPAGTYRTSSSFHSISAAVLALPAVNGLIHFCCGGLSSSTTQQISSTPVTEKESTCTCQHKAEFSGHVCILPFKATQNIHALSPHHFCTSPASDEPRFKAYLPFPGSPSSAREDSVGKAWNLEGLLLHRTGNLESIYCWIPEE